MWIGSVEQTPVGRCCRSRFMWSEESGWRVDGGGLRPGASDCFECRGDWGITSGWSWGIWVWSVEQAPVGRCCRALLSYPEESGWRGMTADFDRMSPGVGGCLVAADAKREPST